MASLVQRFAALRVLVIGDFILDEYVLCEPVGLSQADPTIVVSEQDREYFLGGAGIVAGHCAGLGAETTLVTLAGVDDGYGKALGLAQTASISCVAITDGTRPTTLKRRYRAQGKTLLRINRLSQRAPSEAVAARIRMATMAEVGRKPDLILFSDFGYGTLSRALISEVSCEAQRLGIMMAADNQASSGVCDIAQYRGMELVTPTEREARLSLHDQRSTVPEMAMAMRRQGVAEVIAITLGASGLIVAFHDGVYSIPALNRLPIDTVGAGDALFAVASMGIRCGLGAQSLWLGSIAAALQVSRVGNLPITAADLGAYGTWRAPMDALESIGPVSSDTCRSAPYAALCR